MLKNYKSSSPLPNIFKAIEKTLVEHGAKQVVKDYGEGGKITAISFVVETSKGNLAIRLPAKFDKVKQIFDEQEIHYKEDQPYRTAWATIRDWVDVQMALIDWGMCKLEERFLADAIGKDGRTFFEIVEETGFKQLAAPEEGEVINA